MQKTLFGTLCLLILTVFSVNHIQSVQAQTSQYEAIDIHVTLNEDGSAHFIEQWHANIHEGTENYVIKENLGQSTIENFLVTENGEQYEYLKKWDLNATQQEKAFKNGIIETKNGVELSWGIGDYGAHEYIIEYTVTNIVKQLKDSQILHWTFSNEGINIPRSNITVQIETHKTLNDPDEKVWAFGYPGDVEFVQGNIIARSDAPLSTNDYVILLVQFEDGTFTAQDKINKTFEEVQKKAFAGSDYDTKTESMFGKIFSVIKSIFSTIIIIAIIGFGLFFGKKYNKSNRNSEQPRQFKRQYKEEYYRDYPYEDNYLNTYYVTYLMGLSSFNTLLTALLLKWINEDKIQMTETTSGILRRTHQTIHFLNDDIDASSLESQLFHMIKNRANEEGHVTDREIAKWAERHFSQLQAWENNIMNESKRILTNEKFVEQYEKKTWIFKSNHYRLTESGKEMEENVYKYVNYLHDFSLLNEHEAINVKLWDDIMIWAAYLNLTSVVMKQFEKIYPNYIEETKYRDNSLRRSTYFASTVSRSRHKGEQNRRSSGGGGRASSGGGGGSFGGGSGGGVR